jgi:hypothetical protein
MTSRIQLRRGTASEWSTVNPTLSSGEVGYEVDSGKFKIGNGSTLWSGLDYFGGEVDLSGYLTLSSASTNYLDKTDASVTLATASASVVRNITLSTSNPTGGNDGDVWMVYT